MRSEHRGTCARSNETAAVKCLAKCALGSMQIVAGILPEPASSRDDGGDSWLESSNSPTSTERSRSGLGIAPPSRRD